jgi:hypothetical protein
MKTGEPASPHSTDHTPGAAPIQGRQEETRRNDNPPGTSDSEHPDTRQLGQAHHRGMAETGAVHFEVASQRAKQRAQRCR